MKKMVFAMMVAAAAAAFADGDDNVAVVVKTSGPDKYQDGTVVLDDECYALVWSADGVFDGFTADGATKDQNDLVVNVGAVAKDGRCRAAFELKKSLADKLQDGAYAVYLLDTRVNEGGKVVPRGLVDGKLAVLNGYDEVAEGVKVAVATGIAVASETQAKGGARGGKRISAVAAPAPDVQQPRITRIAPEDGGMALYIENMKGYMRVKKGKDATLSDGVTTPAVQTDGSAEPVRIVVPMEGNSGFFRVIRN